MLSVSIADMKTFFVVLAIAVVATPLLLAAAPVEVAAPVAVPAPVAVETVQVVPEVVAHPVPTVVEHVAHPVAHPVPVVYKPIVHHKPYGRAAPNVRNPTVVEEAVPVIYTHLGAHPIQSTTVLEGRKRLIL